MQVLKGQKPGKAADVMHWCATKPEKHRMGVDGWLVEPLGSYSDKIVRS